MVFSPVVLGPLVGRGLVLGPLVLGPLVLGSLVLGPLVLSPLVGRRLVVGWPVIKSLVRRRPALSPVGAPNKADAATRRTCLLAGALGLVTAALTATGSWSVTMMTPLPHWVMFVALAVGFFAGEQLLMNVEFRRQAHSLTLAGVPLIIGVLIAPLPLIVLARLAGAGLALVAQRISAEKVMYNCASYAFEAAVDALVLHALLGPEPRLGVPTALTVLVVVVLCDQLMSGLVLVVIRWHGGSMSSAGVRDVLVPAAALAVVSTALAVGVLLLAEVGALGSIVACAFGLIAFVAYRGYVLTTRRHQRLEVLHEFVNGGVGAESLNEVAQELLCRIRSLLRGGRAELMLVDEATVAYTAAGSVETTTNSPESRAHSSKPSQIRRTQQHITRIVDDEDNGFSITEAYMALDWVTIRAIDKSEPLLAPRAPKDRAVRQWLADEGCRDAIVVPLPSSSGFTGTLTVTNRLGETATFPSDDLTLLQTLTGHMAVAAGSARLVEQLGYDATHDSLTGLFNRAYLARQINQAASLHATPCVMLLDLDRFKEVNDGLGHNAGDQLLRVVAERLTTFLPASATVARLGGDEFAALLPSLGDDTETALELASNLAVYLANPVVIDEALLNPDVSIGIAVGSGAPVKDLLRQADTAMYAAKSGDSTIARYHPDMDKGRVENLALLADLRMALQDAPEQIAVYYQPKLDLSTRTVVSAEALVRWNHPTLGILSPDRFVPLAESTGLINQFTPLVLNAALAQCHRWRAAGHAVSVAVNLSARNVGDPALPELISRSLFDAGVPSDCLILEITESSIIADPVQSLSVLTELAALGVTVSLDDFGTGYSSLSYLQQLPVKEVKIDRSFVLGLTSDNPYASRALIASIAGLGANLGLRVVAEGAETWPVVDELQQLGCHIAQGYVVARAAPADAFAEWIDAQALLSSERNTQPLKLVAN